MFRTAAVLLFLIVSLAAASVHAGNAANFVGADTATRGSWKGVYGGDGYVMPALTTALIQHLPSYATVTATGKLDFTFVASTTDVRALQKPGVTTDRQCGCWYADTTFDVDVVLTGGATRRIALYCADYDSSARAQRIDVIDPSNSSVLDTRSIAASFNGGVWMVWNITGSVKFRFTDIGTPNTVLNGIFFGGATASQTVDTVWFDDATPAGAVQQGDYAWIFSTANPTPFSGTTAFQSTVAAGTHQHFFTGANPTFRVNKGDILMSHVFLDPANPPTEVMMQWNDGVWDHRAYWGGNGVPFGTDGTNSRRYMGPLPPTGQWVRLEVPAGIVGLEDRDLNGIAFTIFDGRATWDRPGRSTPCALSISPLAPTILIGGSQAFTTTLVDINGAALTPQTPVAFSVSGGGTISAAGVFTPGTVPGTYTVTAFTSASSATASTTITINGPPVAVADTLLVTQNRSRTVTAPGVLGNDTDPENNALTAVKDTDPTNGVLVLNSNGSYTYTPNTNFLGTDSFTYHARDSFTNNSNTVTVTITVAPNVAPVVSGVAGQVTSEDSPVNASVTATDANGDPITFMIVTPPTKGVVTIPNPVVGNYTYTPALDATGTDTFVIGAQDDSGLVGTLTITITILPLNDAPVAISASLQTGNNQPKTGTLTATDVDSTVFTFAIASPPAHGTVVMTNAATGAFLYTPAADYIGADSFTFVVSDGALSSAPGTIFVLVTPGPQFVSQPALTPNPVLAGQGALASAVAPTAVSITWDWGDGTTGSGSSVQHSWTTSGVYQVKVTAVGADGVATVKIVELLVAAPLEGPNNGGATPPGIVGILIGGAGSSTANGKGKVSCNYVRRDKTMYSGTLSTIAFPSTLKQADLAGLTGTLKLGPLVNPAAFQFTLNAKGKGKSTGLPQIELNLKKKLFRFKAQRSDLTELTETLGGPREFAPSTEVTLMIPATLQIGNKVVLAMTFQVSYKQISNGGVGTLTK